MKGIFGKKLGMTQVYDETGVIVPVTVVQAGPCKVLARRTMAQNGYAALQLGFGDRKNKNVSKAVRTHVLTGGYTETAPALIGEIRLASDPKEQVGDTVGADLFAVGETVDVIGVSKGRGFQGVVFRHHFAGGRASHGGGWLRRGGSNGMKEHPGKVQKNKRMAGHMGHESVTVQNLKVVQIRKEENLIFIKGAVPGPDGGHVKVSQAVKSMKIVKKRVPVKKQEAK